MTEKNCYHIHALDGYETYVIDENTIGVRPIWFNVKNRLPTEHEWILLCNIDFQITTWGTFMDGKFVNPDLGYKEIYLVTHWMPLPKPPEY